MFAEPTSTTIGRRYKLQDSLGAGGMGTVYRAHDRLTGNTVALKQVSIPAEMLDFMSRSAITDSLGLNLALAQEFKTLASLRHPNIISVLDYGFDAEHQPYFTMELLANPQSLLDYGRGQPAQVQVGLLVQVLQGLAYLHRRGVIHRDLKPDNALVVHGQVKILDFGLAVGRGDWTESAPVGTLLYVAPEVFAGYSPTDSADLYALGVMAYELLGGEYPFNRKQGIEQLVEDVMTVPADVSRLPVSEALAAVIGRLLSKQPAERYRDAREAILALCAAAGQTPPAESAAIRTSYLEAADFIGRQREIGQLRAALGAAQGGAGSAWLIGGESGVGKSRLAEEVRVQALVAGVLVLRGQAVEGGGLPYQLWREPLRHLLLDLDVTDLEAGVLKPIVPDIERLLERDVPDAPELPGEANQQRLALTMVDLFRRHAEPLALILEDLQWSQESLAPLRQLTRHARTLPLMILANFRDDERPTLPDDLPDMTLLPLKRLSEVEIAALSQSMLGEGGAQESVVYLLQRETEGNVFFLVEVVRALAEASGGLERVGDMTLPAHVFAGGVQRVIQRRLDKVPMWGQSLLRMVALAGRQLDVTVLKQVLDTHPDLLGDHPLDEFLSACDEAAVLEVLDNTWRFAHDKLREALLRNIPPDIRPGLHRQLAEAIERSYPDDKARYSTLFDHWYEAQEIDKSASYARLAAEALMGVSAYRDALAILEKALAMLPPESPMPERMWLLKWQGTAFDVFGNYPRALQCYDDSLTLAQQAQDRACLIEGLIGSSLTLHTRGELAVARQRLEQALATAEELGNQRLISRALMGLGSFYRDGNPSLSRDYSLRAMRICQDINDVQGVAGCHFGVGVTVGTLGDIEGSMKHLETALAIYKQIGDRRGMLSCLNTMANSMGANDRDASVAMRLETLQIARDIGDRLHIAIVLNNLANQYMDAGRYRESAAAQQEALDIYTDLKALVSTGAISANIALSYHELGEFAAALHFAERALEILLPLDGRRFTAFAHYMLAMIYRKYGRLADAWHEGQKGLTLAREVGEAYSVGVNQMELSEIETERGNLDAAETYGGEALALFAQGDVSIDLIMMWTHMGRLRHMQGKWEEARTFYQKGLNLARSLLNTINVATNLAGLADLEMDDQRWEDARAMLAEGLALTAEIDTKHITMRLLAGTARWFIQQGNAERAAELYSFILQHPSAERFTIEAHVRPLYAVLQARLTPEALYEATQRGAAMSLESVMPQVRADLGAAPQP